MVNRKRQWQCISWLPRVLFPDFWLARYRQYYTTNDPRRSPGWIHAMTLHATQIPGLRPYLHTQTIRNRLRADGIRGRRTYADVILSQRYRFQ